MNCASAHPVSDIEYCAFSFCIDCFAEIAKTYLNDFFIFFLFLLLPQLCTDMIPDTYYLIRYSDSLTIKNSKLCDCGQQLTDWSLIPLEF